MNDYNVYAIFPHDEKGNVAGVYVGVTGSVKQRLRNHLYCYSAKNGQQEMHDLMRKNGFHYVILAQVDYRDRSTEYDWIDYFRKMTNYKIFNEMTCKDADWHRIGGESA